MLVVLVYGLLGCANVSVEPDETTPVLDEQIPLSMPANQIAFTTERDGNVEVYSMNADGSAPTNLKNNAAEDWLVFDRMWSPDGQKLMFVSNRDGIPSLFMMNADGSEQTMIGTSGNGFASWSPDGEKIASVSFFW